MVTRFFSPEEAALFAAVRRDEGYFAEVCDDHAARFWGPLAVGGCRVISSETQGEERRDLPPPGPLELFLLWVLRFWALVALIFGLAAVARAAIRRLYLHSLVEAGMLLAICAAAFVVLVFLSLALGRLSRAWRRALAGEALPSRSLLLFFGALLGYLLSALIFFF